MLVYYRNFTKTTNIATSLTRLASQRAALWCHISPASISKRSILGKIFVLNRHISSCDILKEYQTMSGRNRGGGGFHGRGDMKAHNGRFAGSSGGYMRNSFHTGNNSSFNNSPFNNCTRNFSGNVGDGGGDFGNNVPFDLPNNINGNDIMKLMSAMANNFNMNPPPPPAIRLNCGELRSHHVGMRIELTGRLIKKRVSRFVELRDRNGGAAQLVVLEDKYPRVARRLYNMPENSMLDVVGLVTRRPPNSRNQTMPTGDVEVEVQDIFNIGLPPGGNKRVGDKRSYSTMAQQNSCGITSTEYKVASKQKM